MKFNGCQEELRVESSNSSVDKNQFIKHFLKLRSLGIKLEKEKKNLPEDFDNCFSFLEKIGFIEKTSSKGLTEIGKDAVKFLAVSPIFDLATAKFKENHVFGLICSLIIENCSNIIVVNDSFLLLKHFKKDSDIVTFLEVIRDVSDENQNSLYESGLSIEVVSIIYYIIEKTFEVTNGQRAL